MKIAELVKTKRKELGETQEEFGKRFGLSHAAISDMETGKTNSITELILNFILDVEEPKPCPGYCNICLRHCQFDQKTNKSI